MSQGGEKTCPFLEKESQLRRRQPMDMIATKAPPCPHEGSTDLKRPCASDNRLSQKQLRSIPRLPEIGMNASVSAARVLP